MSFNLEYLGTYKDKIISKLISSQNIVDIILPNPSDQYEIEDQLRGDETQKLRGYIFPYEFVPGNNEKASTFICIEDVIPSVPTDTSVNVFIYVFVFTHKDLMQYKRGGAVGTRVDILASDIDKLLNGSLDLGIKRINLEKVEIYKNSNPDYYGRALLYSVSEFNRDRELNG